MSPAPSTWLRLDPADTVSVRGSRPASAAWSGDPVAEALFPPPAATVVGAVRAAFARSLGWSGRGPWPAHLHALLGDGPGDLGALKFRGPFFSRPQPGGGGSELLFPLPATVVGARSGVASGGVVDSEGAGRWIPGAVLQPRPLPAGATVFDGHRLLSEGHPVLQPAPPMNPSGGGGADTPWQPAPAGAHTTLVGLRDALAGRPPAAEAIAFGEDLCELEAHTRIGRDPETGLVHEGALFVTVHARLRPGVGLWLHASGLPAVDGPLRVRLGGRGRPSQVTAQPGPVGADSLLTSPCAGSARAAVALTPVPYQLAKRAGLDDACAAVAEPVWLGGWDGRLGRTGPTALVPHHPAGSVWHDPLSLPVRMADGRADLFPFG